MMVESTSYNREGVGGLELQVPGARGSKSRIYHFFLGFNDYQDKCCHREEVS